MGFKDLLYNSVVRKNENVCREYERYVQEHIEEHYTNRIRQWKILWKLNWHYRVKKADKPMMYWDMFDLSVMEKTSVNEEKKEVKSGVKSVAKPAAKPVAKPVAKPESLKSINAQLKPTEKLKLPYIKGAESFLYNKKEAHYIAKDCMQYDAVSFDIFDTLVCRPFDNPNDLFNLVGYELNIDSFRKLRIRAEKEARDIAEVTKGNREVTIYDIYTVLHRYTGVDVEEGVAKEFQVEQDMCFANLQMKRVFNILKYQGKRIVLTSNMYFPAEMLGVILDKCGYFGYEKIFVSCDYQASKRTGTLFQNVRKYFGEEKRIIHIGDDHEADVLMAKECGLESYFYKNVNKAGRQYRADGMSELVYSAYAGIVNYHIHNGTNIYSKPYEYGFIYGGLYVFGFCNWIHKYVKAHNIDKVLFLSRDGKIYQDVFNSLFDDVENEYVYWSRIANIKYSLDEYHGQYYYLLRMVDDRINDNIQIESITIEDLFKIYHIESLLPKAKAVGIAPHMVLTKENAKVLKSFLSDNMKLVVAAYEKEQDQIKRLIQASVGDCKKVAIIDVGWNGTGPLGLKYLIEKKWKMNCQVSCLLAGSKTADHTANINELMSEQIVPYLFSRNLNRNNYDTHAMTNDGKNSIFFELFTQDTTPSFAGITELGEYLFELPEVENYDAIRDIQKGIIDFSIMYRDAFKKYPYMYNISGYDAYCPFRMIIRDLYFIKRYFSDFIYSRTVGNSAENYSFWKLGDLIK